MVLLVLNVSASKWDRRLRVCASCDGILGVSSVLGVFSQSRDVVVFCFRNLSVRSIRFWELSVFD